MHGLMMDRPLLVSSLIEYAADSFPHRPIVSKRVEGDIHRYDYRGARDRSAQLAHGLVKLGVKPGDRVATLAWNGYRHFELYYAISGIGAVCHTLNPRLFEDQLAYIVNHAKDRFLFIDTTFLPLVEKMIDRFPEIEAVILLCDPADRPETSLPRVHCYEDLLAGHPGRYEWPDLDENQAAGLCYTSGTTGNPKGVLFSHRGNVLHALCVASFQGCRFGLQETMMPVVPLFHANAWGLPYLCPLTGTALVFPGPALDGASLFDLMEAEGATQAWGVPTIWLGLLAEMEKRGAKPSRFASTIIGGSAAARSLIEAFTVTYGIEVFQGWGMTEMSPIGTVCTLRDDMADWPLDRKLDQKAKQGRRVYQVDLRVVDEAGRIQPHDGQSRGELQVRGPFIASAYLDDEPATTASFGADGWFATGDVSTIDPDGYMEIVDRTKDLIKSGGEWISSIDLESEALAHPQVAEAAAIGLPHEKWVERPLLVAVRQPGSDLDEAALRDFLAGRVIKWWLPDAIVFVEELPHTATGKVSKRTLRERFKGYELTGE